MSIGVVKKQSPEHSRKFVISTLGGRDIIELEHSHSSHGADITIGILKARAQRANEILHKVFDAQGAQTPQGEAADHGIVIMAVLLEKIDGEKSEIRIAASVIADVKVAHLLQNEIGGRGAHDHLGEERRHIDADSHVRDDLLVKLPLNVLHARLPAPGQLPQLRLEVGELALAIVRIHGARGRGEEETS